MTVIDATEFLVRLGDVVADHTSLRLAGARDKQEICYVLKDGDQSETGFGIYNDKDKVVTRSWVYESTNGDERIGLGKDACIFTYDGDVDFKSTAGRLKKLEAQRRYIKRRADPIRAERDEFSRKADTTVATMNERLKSVESGLYEIEQEIVDLSERMRVTKTTKGR